MPEFCSCGAKLPPDARFCHKCGKPQYDYPEPEPEPAAAPVAAAPVEVEISFRNGTAVRTGFVAAFLAFLLMPLPLPPFLQVIWLMACPVGAGFVGAYLYRRRTGQRLRMETGARLGWITGVFVFLIVLVVVATEIVYVSANGGLANSIREQFGKNPNMAQALKTLEDPTTMAGGLLLTVVLMFFLFTLLPVVGGALCGKVLDKD